MTHTKYLALIPFACFILGYAALHYVAGPRSFETPALVGLSLIQGCEITTAHALALKIVGHKETTENSPGTILHQTPAAGSRIKAHQSMYVVIAQEPTPLCAANIVGMRDTDIQTSPHARGYKIRLYEVPSIHPRGVCIAQAPSAGLPTSNGQIIAYISQKSTSPIIWPDFTGRTVADVRHFLRTHNIPVSCIHTKPQQTTHHCTDCRVIQQHPRAGSLLKLAAGTAIQVQLQVE